MEPAAWRRRTRVALEKRLSPGDLKTLPLQDLHRAAGARLGAFAGWNMPVTYPLGVLKEHLWTRAHAGLFDISHMKLFSVEGEDAADLLSRVCPIDAGALLLNHGKLTFFLNENAGILDDLIITRMATDRFIVVANAGNAAADETHLRDVASGLNVQVEALDRIFLALQGPDAEDVLHRAEVKGLPERFMTAAETGEGWFVSRSGYTGEDGFEIALPEADARSLVTRILDDDRAQWIGLAARDSLRLEAGLCLHGQDISPETDPVTAALIWAIPKPLREDGGFIGAESLSKIILAGATKKRCGLKPDGRQPVRAGASLLDEEGSPVGSVTSGGFGPSVDHPIAMGLVAAPLAKAGTRLFAEVRGGRVPVTVHSLPFAPHRHRKG